MVTSLDTPDLPTTSAGRTLLLELSRGVSPGSYPARSIAAIEAEAIANHDAALRVVVEGLTPRPNLQGSPVNAYLMARDAVLRLLSEGTPEPGLDAAWREAEAALPEGWELGIGRIWDYLRDHGEWLYWAECGPNLDNEIDGVVHMIGGQSTPAAALQALAAALREQPEREQAGG